MKPSAAAPLKTDEIYIDDENSEGSGGRGGVSASRAIPLFFIQFKCKFKLIEYEKLMSHDQTKTKERKREANQQQQHQNELSADSGKCPEVLACSTHTHTKHTYTDTDKLSLYVCICLL